MAYHMDFKTKEEFLKFMRFEVEHDYGIERITVDGVQQYVKIPLHCASVPEIPEKWRGDRAFITEAVKINGDALGQASEELQRDRDLYLLAVETCNNYKELPPIPAEWGRDRAFVSEALKRDGRILRQASDEVKNDREILLQAAAKHDSFTYEEMTLNDEVRADKEFLLKLLSVNGLLLFRIYGRGLTPEQADMDLVRAALSQNYSVVSIFSYDALHNRDFVKQLVNIHGRVLEYLAPEFRDDEELVYDAVVSYRAFEFASNRLKNDEAFLMKILDKNPSCIAYAPVKYREDRELMTKLIDRHPYVYRYVKGALQKDLPLALYAVKKDVKTYAFLRDAFKKNVQVKEILQGVANDTTKSEEERDYAMRMLGLKK